MPAGMGFEGEWWWWGGDWLGGGGEGRRDTTRTRKWERGGLTEREGEGRSERE